MAEAIYTHLAEGKTAHSAGVFAEEGAGASEHTLFVLKENGMDFHHQASLITPEKVKNAKIILTMTASHRDLLSNMYPEMKEKVYTIKQYVTDVEGDVIDPFGGDLAMYQQTYEELLALIEKLIDREEDCK